MRAHIQRERGPVRKTRFGKRQVEHLTAGETHQHVATFIQARHLDRILHGTQPANARIGKLLAGDRIPAADDGDVHAVAQIFFQAAEVVHALAFPLDFAVPAYGQNADRRHRRGGTVFTGNAVQTRGGVLTRRVPTAIRKSLRKMVRAVIQHKSLRPPDVIHRILADGQHVIERGVNARDPFLNHLAVLFSLRGNGQLHRDIPMLVGHGDRIELPARDQRKELFRASDYHIVGATPQTFPQAPEMRRHAHRMHALRDERLIQKAGVQIHMVAGRHKQGHLRGKHAGHPVLAHKKSAEERDSHFGVTSFVSGSFASGSPS